MMLRFKSKCRMFPRDRYREISVLKMHWNKTRSMKKVSFTFKMCRLKSVLEARLHSGTLHPEARNWRQDLSSMCSQSCERPLMSSSQIFQMDWEHLCFGMRLLGRSRVPVLGINWRPLALWFTRRNQTRPKTFIKFCAPSGCRLILQRDSESNEDLVVEINAFTGNTGSM